MSCSPWWRPPRMLNGPLPYPLQVHYLKPRPPGDRSGVQLTLHGAATPHAAGVLAYAAGFAIPPNTPSTLVDNECCYQVGGGGAAPMLATVTIVSTFRGWHAVY